MCFSFVYVISVFVRVCVHVTVGIVVMTNGLKKCFLLKNVSKYLHSTHARHATHATHVMHATHMTHTIHTTYTQRQNI